MNDHLSNRQVLYGPAVPLFNYNHNHDPKNGQFTFAGVSGGDNGRFTATGGNSSPIAGGNPRLPTRSTDLHPRESLKQLATATGASGTIAGADVPPQTTLPTSKSLNPRQQGAIHRAMNLPINPNSDRNNGTSKNPYISHYGWGLDPNQDSYTNPPPGSGRKPTGNHNNDLDIHSLAISADVARDNHLKVGDKVYINGQYIGNYDDTAPEDNTIDVYDPHNAANDKKWGGTVREGARVTGRR